MARKSGRAVTQDRPERPWDASAESRGDSDRAPTPMDAWVGARVRARRLQVGWTIAELSQTIGVSRQQMEKWEAGRTRISAGRLYDIAKALDVNPGWFFEEFPGGAVSQVRPPSMASMATAEGIQILTVFNDLPAEQKRALRLVADGFAALRQREETFNGTPHVG